MRIVVRAGAISLAVAVLLASLASAEEKKAGGPPASPPARKVPGLNAEDPHPNACVDCHKDMPEMKMDVRLSTLMKAWNTKVEDKLLAKAQAAAPAGAKLTGKHPAAAGALESIPKKCLTCHSEKSTKAPPFGRMMHAIHLVGGDENHFMTYYQGDCTHCHKLDQKTGAWSLPSAAEPK